MAKRKMKVPLSDEVQLPSDGIHEGVPFHIYQEWPALNQSVLKHGLTTPKHMKAAWDGLMTKGDSEAMRLGRALHSKLLEPEKFNDQWVVSQGCGAVLGTGQRKGETCGKAASFRELPPENVEELDEWSPLWFCGTHAKKQPCEEPIDFLTFDQVADIDAICEEMKGDPTIALLRSLGGCEVSLVYDMNGVKCKCRLDKFIKRTKTKKGELWPPTIVDIKKVRVGHATEEHWENAVRTYRYDIQAAWYVDAVGILTGEVPVFMWVMIEEGYPYDINVKFCSPSTLSLGRREYQRLFGMFQYGMESNEWHGYKTSMEIGNAGVPDWFLKRRNEFLDTVRA